MAGVPRKDPNPILTSLISAPPVSIADVATPAVRVNTMPNARDEWEMDTASYKARVMCEVIEGVRLLD